MDPGCGVRRRPDFFWFLLILLVPLLFYLAAALVLPPEQSEGEYDLREHYFGIHRLFFSVIAAATLLETLRALRVADEQAAGLNFAGTLLLASLAIVRNPRYHALGTALAALLLVGFVIVETLRIT